MDAVAPTRPTAAQWLGVLLPCAAVGALLAFGPGLEATPRERALCGSVGLLLALLAGAWLWRLAPRDRRAFSASLVLSLALAGALELGVSLWRWKRGRTPASCWLFDRSDRTFRFDPARGYALTQTPSRFARITLDQVEYAGAYRGNNQGFQDLDDFGPARERPGARRIAVFGDSFSTGAFLEMNWPDRAERLARERGQDLQLLNFSVDGGGLGNWHSIVRNVVEAQDYQLDGVLFAVFYDDLWRTFSFAEHRGFETHMFTRADSWDPRTYPRTDAEARARLRSMGAPIVDAATFDRALARRLCPWEDTSPRSYEWVLSTMLTTLARAPAHAWLAPRGNDAHALPPEDPQRLALRRDLARWVRERGLRVWVLFVPTRGHLLDPERYEPDPLRDDQRAFARELGAEYLDGREAFRGLSRRERAQSFFPYDAHWNQRGSDRFASYMAGLLTR